MYTYNVFISVYYPHVFILDFILSLFYLILTTLPTEVFFSVVSNEIRTGGLNVVDLAILS